MRAKAATALALGWLTSWGSIVHAQGQTQDVVVNGVKIGQVIGLRKNVTVGSQPVNMCFEKDPAVTQNVVLYPVLDFSRILPGGNISAPLRMVVEVKSDQFCGTFIQSGPYVPIRRIATVNCPSSMPFFCALLNTCMQKPEASDRSFCGSVFFMTGS